MAHKFSFVLLVLGDDKERFLDGVERSVKDLVAIQSLFDCLTIVEIRRDNSRLYFGISQTYNYMIRLVYFIIYRLGSREHPRYGESTLDSWLTDPVIKMVAREYESLFERNQEVIVQSMARTLLENTTLKEALRQQVILSTERLSPMSEQRQSGQQQPRTLSNQQIFDDDKDNRNVTSVIPGSVAHLIKTFTFNDLSTMASLSRSMEHSMRLLLAEHIASEGLMYVTRQVTKGAMIPHVVSGIGLILTATIGMVVGNITIWFLMILIIPVLLVLASSVYNIITFPAELAEKMAPGVKEILKSSYLEQNSNILSEVFTDAVENNLPKLVEFFVKTRLSNGGSLSPGSLPSVESSFSNESPQSNDGSRSPSDPSSIVSAVEKA
jgi:hypothetical protein